METSADTLVLDKILEPLASALTPELARKIVDLRADAETQALIDILGDKANEGTLTEAERRQYETYVRAGTLVSILQAKARKLISNGVYGNA
jgi:hypothetical protein